MSSPAYLTIDEVIERYRGQISEGTFRNRRRLRIGPSFIKIGRVPLYPVDEVRSLGSIEPRRVSTITNLSDERVSHCKARRIRLLSIFPEWCRVTSEPMCSQHPQHD